MKKANQKKSTAHLANEIENVSTETSPQKVVIADECGDTLWDDILKQDEKNLQPKVRKENNQPFEDSNQLDFE